MVSGIDLGKKLEPGTKHVPPAPLVLTEEEKREREADLERIADQLVATLNQGFGSALIYCGSGYGSGSSIFSYCGSGFRIRIPDPDPGSGSRIQIPDPDPRFDDLKLKKLSTRNLIFIFLIKNCNLPIPWHP
jgi:hypothetical protein